MSEDNGDSTNRTADIGQFFSSVSPGDMILVHFLDSREESAATLAAILERLVDEHGTQIEFLDGPLMQARHHIKKRCWFGNYRATAFRLLPQGSCKLLTTILHGQKVSLSLDRGPQPQRIHICS
jgi:hypothetical protein